MRILLSLLFLLCIPYTTLADVITQDPNTPGTQQETAATQSADPRLAQKITCTPGYTRLHTVVEELSKTSGVTIRCGKNNDDWHVRDIPVVVWVKDLPLGKVLEALAAATHTQLTSNRLGDIITYRISYSSKLERQSANYEEEKQKAIVDGLKWDWDTAVKLKDMPDTAYAPGKDPKSQAEYTGLCISDRIACARASGTVLSVLGPQIRDKIIDSDGRHQVSWDDASPALRTALLDLGRATTEQHKAIMIRQTNGSFDASTLPRVEACKVSLSFTCRKDVSSASGLTMSINLQDGDVTGFHSYGSDLGRDTSSLVRFINGIDIGKRPICPELPTDEPPAGYIKLAKESEGNDPPFLKMTVNLTAPTSKQDSTDKQDLTTADALVELARTAGLSIVSADFQSQLDTPAALMFGKERSIADVLRRFNQLLLDADLVPYGGRDWFVDEKKDLILGRSMDWVRDYNDLVPEKLVSDLSAKMNGSGVLLDDLMPVLGLSKGQQTDWITMSREMQPLKKAVSSLTNNYNSEWWKFYSKLSKEEITVVQSKEGFALDSLASDEAIQILTSWESGRAVAKVTFGSVDAIDPAELKYFSLQLHRNNYGPYYQLSSMTFAEAGGQLASDDGNDALLKEFALLVHFHEWMVEINYDKGDVHKGSSTDIGPFPVFSPKRLAELKEQAEKAKGK